MLNRLIEPTAGNIYIDGDMITNMSKDQLREVRRKKISMVFQKFALFPHRTILENTEYGLELQGVDKQERQQKALESLNSLDWKDLNTNIQTSFPAGCSSVSALPAR